MTKRRTFTAEYKFKVALEAAKGTKTLVELAQEYQLHPNQISEWKQHLLKMAVRSSAKTQADASASKRFWKPNCMSKLAASRWNWSG